MPLRLTSLARVSIVLFLFLVILHFLSSPRSTPESYAGYTEEELEGGWTERLGLDHYADWEQGVTNRLGDGLDRVVGGLGAIKGGLGWGVKGTKLGSLYELVSTSNPSPRPAYFDERTSLDRIKLTSTRVLGHGDASSESATADDDEDAVAARPRRHILITGGFGSMGKYVVRDLLLGPSSGYGTAAAQDEWSDGGEGAKEEDILVTILDVKDRTPELNFLLQSAPIDKGPKIKGTDPRTQAFTSSERSVDNFKRAGKLRTLVGDVRDPKLMATILAAGGTTITQTGTQQAAALLNAKLGRPNKGSANHLTTTIVIPPVSGIIHLAAYDPKSCRLNPVDCEDVETKGMETILESLKREGMDKAATLDGQQGVIAERPWVVVPRRSGAWEEVLNTFNANASALSTPAAEEALKAFSVHHPLHSLLLHLPSSDSILGDPYSPRFDPIPHIVQSTMGHLPVQIYTSPTQTGPFLAIDDASRAVIQGARMLELASKKEYLRPLAFVGELTVVGPPNKGYGISPLVQVAQTAIALTQSQSAYAEIPLEGEKSSPSSSTAAEQPNQRKLTSKVLGFTPATSIRTALKRYLTSLLKLQSTHLSSRINVACSSPPSTPVLEEGLLALSGCNSQLLTVIEGAYYTLGCSAGIETPHPEPLAIVPAVPFKEGVRGVEILAERGLEGKVDVQLRCPTVDKEGKLTGQSEVVIWADTERGGEFAEQSKEGAHAIAEWYSIDFIHRDSRSFTLTLPPTEGVPEGEEPKRRLTLKDPMSQKRDVLFQPVTEEARALLWRVNPICCSASDRRKDVWDFFKEDPILTSQVTYPSEDGRTTLSESTLSIKRCADLRSEHDQLIKLQRFLASSRSDTLCTPDRGTAHEWTPKDLPTCHIDCSAPLVCMASETCKCTRDRCGDKLADGPFPSIRHSMRKSFNDTNAPSSSPSLTERVEAIPWESLILPGARRAFATPLDDLPAAHVIDLPETIDNHLTSAACWNLDKSPLPFMGDHFMVEALRNRSVSMDEADFVIVPYYQGCYYNYLQENTFKKLADTVGYAETRVAAAKHISASRIIIPFTHDFGSCTGWWSKLEDVLGRSPPSPMDQAIAWQVNGDYNTHCVKPDRDVVIPAVTKHTKALLTTFSAFSSVTPSSKRKHLGFFAGGVRGFGAIVRTKIGCGRTTTDVGSTGGDGESRILYQEYALGQRYLGTLNSSKFCLLPRGIPAWTTRTFEAIYAGCIPAFVVDRNLFPFQDILDYSRFSITIPEAEAHRAEDILASYSDDRLADLQANLLRVREAFIFKEGEEWERKGPVFFSLVSMAMRLDLEYPQVGSCVQ